MINIELNEHFHTSKVIIKMPTVHVRVCTYFTTTAGTEVF